MNTYETILIFNGKLTAEQIEAKEKEYLHKILSPTDVELAAMPAKVHEIKGMGLKKLAYEIKGNKEGWYTIFTYSTEPERIVELERLFRIDDDIIKFLTMKRNSIEVDTSKSIEEETVHKVYKKKEVDAFDLIFG